MENELIFPHKLILSERKDLTLTGVSEVISFDDSTVVLKTAMGILTVLGEQLVLKTLLPDGGQVAVSGHVSSVMYEEPRPEGFWRRLLG